MTSALLVDKEGEGRVGEWEGVIVEKSGRCPGGVEVEMRVATGYELVVIDIEGEELWRTRLEEVDGRDWLEEEVVVGQLTTAQTVEQALVLGRAGHRLRLTSSPSQSGTDVLPRRAKI